MTIASIPIAKWYDRFSAVAVLVLVILLAYSLAKFTWFLVVGDQGGAVSADSIQVVSSNQPSSQGYVVNIRQLQSWHLFGEVGKESGPIIEKTPEKIVDTSLRLELEGVFVAPDPKNSSAIISESNREGVYYKVGDKLPQNATLESVHSDKVVLRRNGRLEQLTFPKESQAMSAASRSVSVNERNASRRFSTRSGGRDSARASNSRVGSLLRGGGMPNPTQVIQSLNEDVQSNVQGLMDEMGVETVPLNEGGGVRITRQAPAEIKQMLGLRDGDVIKSVNGQILSNTSEIQGLVQQYAQGGECQAQIELQRGSRVFTVNLDVCSGTLF